MKTNLIKRLTISLACGIVFISLLLSVARVGSSAETINWGYSPCSPGSPGSAYYTYTWGPLADIISADTKGRLKLTVHEALIPDARVIEGVRDGTVDMGTQIVFYRGELGLLNFVALPFIPREKLPEIVAQMRPTFSKVVSEKPDVVLLGYGYWARQRLITKTPVRTLEDLKGYKIRVHNPETLELMKAAGASPIFLPMSEVYPALQRGVINGGVTSLEGVMGNKWYEVLKFVNNWPMGNGSYIWIANKKSWAALPSDLQNQILKLFKDKYEMATFNGGLEDDARQQRQLEAQGVQFVQPDPKEVEKYLANVPPILAKWKERIGPETNQLMAVVNKVLGTKY
jgi:TRAP-type C4-dicarboxylate transport system substrate-binding protein